MANLYSGPIDVYITLTLGIISLVSWKKNVVGIVWLRVPSQWEIWIESILFMRSNECLQFLQYYSNNPPKRIVWYAFQ